MPEVDAAVIAQARGGDSEAFRVLVEQHSRAVYQLAYRVTGNAQDAEDVVQETFLKAYRQLGRFEARSSFGTWLHRIAMNCSVDLLRGRPKREQAEESESLELMAGDQAAATSPVAASPERLAVSSEVGDRVRAAMNRLTSLERAVFALRHFEGYSIEEIGKQLGMRESATKHSVFRAVKKMRLALEPYVD